MPIILVSSTIDKIWKIYDLILILILNVKSLQIELKKKKSEENQQNFIVFRISIKQNSQF